MLTYQLTPLSIPLRPPLPAVASAKAGSDIALQRPWIFKKANLILAFKELSKALTPQGRLKVHMEQLRLAGSKLRACLEAAFDSEKRPPNKL